MTKYHAVPTELDGLRFASRAESRRYAELKLMQQAGEISGLECQVKYPIHVKDTKVCTYIADFVYIKDGERVVEDCKGYRTPVYKLKAKLLKAAWGIDIQEVA